MKKNIALVLLLFISIPSFALHIAGGELYYSYFGPGSAPGSDSYQVTLRLFRECIPVTPPGQVAAPMPGEVEIGIFTNQPDQLYKSLIVMRSDFEEITLNAPLTCIINPPHVCYQIGYFTFKMDFPKQAQGYTIAYQTCCRSFSIQNIQFFQITGQQSAGEGATYTCTIPGTDILGPTGTNSSAVFAVKDTVLVCQQKQIKLDFSATDIDSENPLYGDSLSYSFCDAYNRGTASGSGDVLPSTPPYQNVTYTSGYSGSSPLGPNIVIDPKTGIITGTIAGSGGYVVNVCVTEWRHGEAISVHRKDFLLRVAACDFAAADLKPSYITCNGYSLFFQNESTSAAIHSYYWDFGAETTPDTSNNPTPTWTYADTGTYTVKLVVNRGEQCSDSTTALAGVYPGFFPAFNVAGNCLENPYQFVDATVTTYGYVSNWLWNFGDNISTDTSSSQNPYYQYSTPGTRNVTLIVSNSKGCTDTLAHQVAILTKPIITLPFKDTLICIADTLQLSASTGAVSQFSWSPGYNIINPNTQNPSVYPQSTTNYIVFADDGKGCTNTDTLTVNVVSAAFVNLGNDTTICSGDGIPISPQTNALYFSWTPATALSDPTVATPVANPQTTTQYTVLASISKKCMATDSIQIKVVPYPLANAGPDTTICFGKTAQFNASINGSSFLWSPVNSLFRYNTLTPVAGPQSTTIYTLSAYDTLGCPKPGIDSVIVTVLPPVDAYAGNDTSIVFNQPLQLNATGGVTYQWLPLTGLNNPGISDPVAILGNNIDSITYKVLVTTAQGCSAYSDVTVHVFKTLPEIFVPSAFTPNGDGKNDILKPIIVGIKQFNFFQVYNRWGNMLFSSGNPSFGWDGTFGGTRQQSGTYVYVAQAVDYLGHTITRKGTVVLIR